MRIVLVATLAYPRLAYPTLPFLTTPRQGGNVAAEPMPSESNRWKLVSPRFAKVGLTSVCRSWSDLILVQVVKLGNRMFYVIDVEPVLP